MIAVGWPVAVALVVIAGSRLATKGWVARQLVALRRALAVFRPVWRGIAVTALQLGA